MSPRPPSVPWALDPENPANWPAPRPIPPGYEFACRQCDRFFRNRNAVVAHARELHFLPPCGTCGDTFETRTELNAHCAAAHNEPPHAKKTAWVSVLTYGTVPVTMAGVPPAKHYEEPELGPKTPVVPKPPAPAPAPAPVEKPAPAPAPIAPWSGVGKKKPFAPRPNQGWGLAECPEKSRPVPPAWTVRSPIAAAANAARVPLAGPPPRANTNAAHQDTGEIAILQRPSVPAPAPAPDKPNKTAEPSPGSGGSGKKKGKKGKPASPTDKTAHPRKTSGPKPALADVLDAIPAYTKPRAQQLAKLSPASASAAPPPPVQLSGRARMRGVVACYESGRDPRAPKTKCWFCGRRYATERAQRAHMVNVHFWCRECEDAPMLFASWSELDRHARLVHAEPEVFWCEKHNFRAEDEVVWNKHVDREHYGILNDSEDDWF